MQEFFERKKEVQKQEKKKKPPVHKPLNLSMSEGPMLLKAVQESKKIETEGRASYEKSVKIELGTLKGKKKDGKKGKKGKKEKK